MKNLMRLAIAFFSLLAGSEVALAQSIPPGSYQRSCTGIDADWRRLSATCRTRVGGWNYTVLEDYRRCRGDIVNNNGHLECAGYDDDQNDDDDNGYSPDWAPRGSYQNSCRNIHVERDTLTAECRDRYGRYRYTELDDYRRCRGDIANDNGVLECRRNDDDWDDDHGNNLPGGSWRASCRNYRMYGATLYAECRTRYGNWVQTSIDTNRCRREIVNDNGRLTCGYQGQGWGRITLYKHSNYGGKSRTVTNDVPDLNSYSFGNIASSAVVEGGVWQLCDRPYYKGYCIVIDRTHANFASIGFNDRAESIRRLR